MSVTYITLLRLSMETMEHAQEEEFLHFSMDLEFLLRRTPKWRVAARNVLFREGDIVENAEKGEDAEDKI